MKSQICARLAYILALFGIPSALLCDTAESTDGPDPSVLIRAIASARAQIPPCTLKLRFVYASPFVRNERYLTVDFDGDKRRFISDLNSADERTVFDGSQALTYSPGFHQAEVRNLRDPNSMVLFDPRLIGLNPYFAWLETIDSLLPYETAAKIAVTGEETVGTNRTWHVHVTMVPPAFDSDFWIAKDGSFRVYRHDLNRVQTLSYYEKADFPWLPSRVESKQFDGKDELLWEYDCEIIQAKANVRLAEATWTAKGLNLPSGTPVIDVSAHSRIGYWSGTTVVPTLGDIGDLERPKMTRFLILLAIVAGATILLRAVASERRRKTLR